MDAYLGIFKIIIGHNCFKYDNIPENTINQTKSQSSLRLPLGAIKATKKLTIRKMSAIRSAEASCISDPF